MAHRGKAGSIKKSGKPRERKLSAFSHKYGMSPSAWARKKKELRANGKGFKIAEMKR